MSRQNLINPITGSIYFGIIPPLKLSGVMRPEGQIVLPMGRHVGPSRGFGANHIWAEHQNEMLQAGWTIFDHVPAYVASIVRTGTPLYFEGASYRNTRLIAVRSSTGTAILELREQRDEVIWSVVTAFSGNKTHGTRVGAVR